MTGADKITVKLKDGRQFPAKLTGTDEKTDIAVVKIEATDLPVEELADSDSVRVGELACAIGVPYNLDYTFTTGVVSAKGRNRLNLGSADNYEDYIQTDASINPGNSGGPLVNLDGKVIGMNTLINGLNRGLGFAIPSNMLREVGDQLIHSGRVIRPYIGVRMETLEEAMEFYGPIFGEVKKGVVVVSIMADSPAFKNRDLHQADVITEVDGVPVGSDRELQKQILSKKVGATVQLTVVRKGKAIKLPVTTAELPAEVAANSATGPGVEPDVELQRQEAAQFGMQLQDLNRDLASNLGVTANSGVVVTSVAEDSPAARALINVKDVITAVDDRPVKDVASFKEAAKSGEPEAGNRLLPGAPGGEIVRGHQGGLRESGGTTVFACKSGGLDQSWQGSLRRVAARRVSPAAMNQKLIREIGRSQRLDILTALKRRGGMSVKELAAHFPDELHGDQGSLPRAGAGGIPRHVAAAQAGGPAPRCSTG